MPVLIPLSLFIFISAHFCQLAPAIIITWSLSYPTYITFGLLVWSCIELLLSSQTFFRYTRFLVLVVCELYLLMQTIFNIDLGLDWPAYPEVGLQRYIDPPAFVVIGLQAIFLLAFALFAYPLDPVRPAVPHRKSSRRLSRGHEYASVDGEEQPPSPDTPFTFVSQSVSTLHIAGQSKEKPQGKKKSSSAKLRKALAFLSLVAKIALKLLLEYVYLISLVVLYFCGLESVNIINSVFCGSPFLRLPGNAPDIFSFL